MLVRSDGAFPPFLSPLFPRRDWHLIFLSRLAGRRQKRMIAAAAAAAAQDGWRTEQHRSVGGRSRLWEKETCLHVPFFPRQSFPPGERRVILKKIHSRTRGGKSEEIDCLHIPRQSLLGMTVSTQKDSGRGRCMQRRREEGERDAIKATQFDLEKGDGNDRSSQCACSVSVVVQ